MPAIKDGVREMEEEEERKKTTLGDAVKSDASVAPLETSDTPLKVVKIYEIRLVGRCTICGDHS